MTPERLQQIKDLFNSALEREPDERAAFLSQACGIDNSLRRSVESLLAHHQQARSFIESPAIAVAASLFEDEKPELLEGQSIGRYKLLELLGAGGMGEVYLAQDTTLGRKVALKLLPTLYTKDADRLRRFEQEARTASALNHPNIVTIYEIGHVDSTHFIATEYLDGVTLRAHLATTRMKTSEALDIAVQVASALAAAHAKGVIHRDIKPENIMVLKASYSLHRENCVKVLDFGIAKLTEVASSETEAPTQRLIKTDQGVVLGTTSYMSPEQARGIEVDARTDIWSLGVVLYEMLAGKIPFEGETAEDVRATILKDKLPPLSVEIPERLKWIVEKALRKDREDRYQTAREFFSDLRELQKQEFASEAMREHSLSREASGGEQVSIPTVPAAISGSREAAAPATSSAEYIISEIKRHKRGLVIATGGILVSLTILGFALYKFVTERKESSPLNLKISRLTISGKALDAAISHDGNYVAYVIDDNGRQSLWVRQVVSENSLQLVPPMKTSFWRPTFSPDGTQVYYGTGEHALYQVSVLGGTPNKIMDNVGDFTLAPDGKQVAFTHGFFESADRSLMVANVDGTSIQTLASRVDPDWIAAASWSPDGKVIAFVSGVVGGSYFDLFELRVGNKKERQLTSQKWLWFDRIAWLPDGSGLLMTAVAQSSPFQQIWQVSYPGGEAKRLINDLNWYSALSIAANSALVVVQSNGVSNIWISSMADPGKAKQITFGAGRYEDLSWSPDGKIVYASDASGHAEIWTIQADGTDPKKLTNNSGRNYGPIATPDGHYVVFHSDRTGAWNIWRANTDGSNLKQLTIGEWASCSPDGRWLIYVVKGKLWKISIEGGEPVQITQKNTFSWAPVVSPKGDLVACFHKRFESSPWTVAIIRFEGGEPVKTFAVPIANISDPAYQWTTDGRALVYVNTSSGVSNLWIQPLDGSRPKQLTDFKSETFNSFDLSRDGKLAISRATSTSDVVLISGVK